MLSFSGGKSMSTIRHTVVIASLVALTVLMTLIGCEPDRKGTAVENQKPVIGIVNTPPDGAQFSRNPELNWYATDIDGYISFFRHAVIVDSLLTINGNPVTPEEYVAQATEDMYDWDTLTVDLDHPQSSATIRLFADTLDPVNTFINQYFFVQACDDQGALSDIAYREYGRNNNYPNTRHRSGDLFINALNANSAANGISVNWEGADSADWGRTEPPLEYEWRLYGPFDVDANIYVNVVKEDCVYDPIADSLINCRDVYVLDVDAIPDTMYVDPGDGRDPVPMAQPVATSQGPNYANDPNDTWVTETRTTIYNVFAGLDLQKTTQYKFVFWVRARDDGFVPDPTPAFSQFKVVEALFEKDVAVVDDTYQYTINSARFCPLNRDLVKSMFNDYIHGAGYLEFDTAEDFFDPSEVNKLKVIDALTYKTLIYHSDDEVAGIRENKDDQLLQIYLGLDQGATAWLMARNITGEQQAFVIPGETRTMTSNFQNYFGVNSVSIEAFNYYTLNTSDGYFANPLWIEEFIGAYPENTDYPQLYVDYTDTTIGETTSRLDSLYLFIWMVTGTEHKMQGYPMVGIANKSQIASPVYLYYSRFGDQSQFHGKVCGVRAQPDGTRTSCYLFPPLAMEPESMQEAFDITIDWLMEKFSSVSAAKPGIGLSDNQNLEERRRRTQEYLEYISEFTSPEEKKALGIDLKPFVVH